MPADGLHKYEVNLRKYTDFWGMESDILWSREEIWADSLTTAIRKVFRELYARNRDKKESFFENFYCEARRIK